MALHLDILFPSVCKFFQSELSLTRVDSWRRSDAGALALWSRCDSLHGVEVLRGGAPFFYSSAGAPAQGSDNTFTPTVRAFRDGFHFVIITQQLQREEDGYFPPRCQNVWIFTHEIMNCPQNTRSNEVKMDVSSYLRENVFLAIYLLLKPLILLYLALKLWPGILAPGLWRCRATWKKRTAHSDNT